MAARKLFARKLSEAWGVDERKLKVPARTPLSEWAVPRTVESQGVRALNWAEWGVVPASQAAGLLDLRGADPGFFLWKRASSDADMDYERVREEAPSAEHASTLAEQTVPQLLRDEVRGEKRRALFASAKAARDKLRDADAVLVSGEGEGMVVLSPPRVFAESFANPDAAMARVRRLARGDPIVFLDVVLGNKCPSRQAATRLVKHVEATHPLGFLVVFAPPVVSTLRFYADLGFAYASEDTDNLLPRLVERLETANKVWHSGFPWLTYLDPHIEDTRIRVSAVSEDVVPEPDHVDNYAADEDVVPDAFVWVNKGEAVDAVVDATQALLSRMPDASVTLVATAPEDAQRVLREARARPLPAFACTMDSPVAEALPPEYEAYEDYVAGDEGEDYVAGDEDYVAGDELLDAPDVTLFYTPKGVLKRRVAQHVVAFALRAAGVQRRTLTAELRPHVAEVLDLDPVRKGQRGMLLVKAGEPVVTHACVYTMSGDTVRLVASACPVDDEVSRLFALLLRLQWGEKKRIVGAAGGCASLATYLQEETTANLFEAAIPVETRRAFASACAVGAASLCAPP